MPLAGGTCGGRVAGSGNVTGGVNVRFVPERIPPRPQFLQLSAECNVSLYSTGSGSLQVKGPWTGDHLRSVTGKVLPPEDLGKEKDRRSPPGPWCRRLPGLLPSLPGS